jgi:aldose 1-epimerase
LARPVAPFAQTVRLGLVRAFGGGGMAGVSPSGEQWTIKADDHEAVVVEVGGGLRGYRVAGVDIVDGYAEGELCAASAGQVLAPWPNRIRDGRYTFAGESYQLPLTEPTKHNAIHGLVNWVRWRITHSTDDSVTLQYDLPPCPGYPWPLAVRTTWTVGPSGLGAEHSTTNLGDRPCPFGFATHPYLSLPGTAVDDLTLHVPARSRLLVDGRSLPIGAARVAGSDFDFTQPRRIGPAILDTAFGDLQRDPDGGSAVTLSTVDGRGIRVWADAAFGWWQVFTADTLDPPRLRRSVAIEPMTCPPDAFRSGRDLIVLEPGQTWRGTWGIIPV